MSIVRDFMLHDISLEQINETFISLIPKTSNPLYPVNFRPIILCNTIYKIIAKVLANRLKSVLHSITGEEQEAFLQGWLISNNILLGFEAFYWL